MLCFVVLLNRKCLTLLFGWSCEGLFGGFLSSMVSPGGRGCSFIFGCGRCSRGGFMMSTGGFLFGECAFDVSVCFLCACFNRMVAVAS